MPCCMAVMRSVASSAIMAVRAAASRCKFCGATGPGLREFAAGAAHPASAPAILWQVLVRRAVRLDALGRGSADQDGVGQAVVQVGVRKRVPAEEVVFHQLVGVDVAQGLARDPVPARGPHSQRLHQDVVVLLGALTW